MRVRTPARGMCHQCITSPEANCRAGRKEDVRGPSAGSKCNQRQHILQLVAEAVSAAGLIEPGAGAHAGVERLLDKPWEEAVERLFASLDAQRIQARAATRLPLPPAPWDARAGPRAPSRLSRALPPSRRRSGVFLPRPPPARYAPSAPSHACRHAFQRGRPGAECRHGRERPRAPRPPPPGRQGRRGRLRPASPRAPDIRRPRSGVQIGGIARVHASSQSTKAGDGALAIPCRRRCAPPPPRRGRRHPGGRRASFQSAGRPRRSKAEWASACVARKGVKGASPGKRRAYVPLRSSAR